MKAIRHMVKSGSVKSGWGWISDFFLKLVFPLWTRAFQGKTPESVPVVNPHQKLSGRTWRKAPSWSWNSPCIQVLRNRSLGQSMSGSPVYNVTGTFFISGIHRNVPILVMWCTSPPNSTRLFPVQTSRARHRGPIPMCPPFPFGKLLHFWLYRYSYMERIRTSFTV